MNEPAVLTALSDAGDVARVTINRADQGNTLMEDVLDGLEEALTTVERDERVVVVVFTGTGDRHFCSGLNAGLMTGDKRDRAPAVLERAWRLAKRVADLRAITVASIMRCPDREPW